MAGTRYFAILALFLPAVSAPSQTVDFRADVQPILAKNCKACHQGGAAPADLRLDSAAGLLQGSISGKVVIPGNSRKSLLLQRINGENGLRMPLNGKPLSSDEIATIRRWIEAGARIDVADLSSYSSAAKPGHWAYVKPVRAALPQVLDTNWVRNPIDRFVLARSEKEGLKPSPVASKETLIRRVSLDLTGLPPTPAEVDEFVTDARADAYERLVDRLLTSPRYGERWATPWLDLARYGDSNGLRDDRQRVAWPYRDWVIRALNRNMPFDQFTIEQLAGDLLPNATIDQKLRLASSAARRCKQRAELIRKRTTGTRRSTGPAPSEQPGLDRASAVRNATTTNTIPSRKISSTRWWRSSITSSLRPTLAIPAD